MDDSNRWSKLVAKLLGLVLLASAQSAIAIRVSAALPAGAPTQFVLQLGEESTFAIDFSNLDNTPGMGSSWSFQRLIGLGSRWLIEPLDPYLCGFPTPAEGTRLEFPVELQALETRRCVYSVKRMANAYGDGHLQLCLGHQPSAGSFCIEPALLVFGTLPDIGLTMTALGPADAGSTATLFRVDASNASAVPTDESSAFTGCQYTGGNDPLTSLSFRIETGFPGACPAATILSCAADPPVLNHSWQVRLPSIPAGASASCLLRIQPTDPSNHETIIDRLSTWLVHPFFPGHPIPLLHAGAWAGAGNGYDMNPSNNVATLQLAPFAQPLLPVPIGGWPIWSALVLLLLGASGLLHRQCRSARMH